MNLLSSLTAVAVVGAMLFIKYVLFSKKNGVNLPPLVHISEQDMFRYPRRAYETALKDNGSIIRVLRRGRIEYIVDNTLVVDVLANEADFSFEKGTLSALNMGFLLYLPRSFVGTLDQLVYNEIIGKIETTIDKISPVFYKIIGQFKDSVCRTTSPSPVDITKMVHQIMSEAMLTLIMGKEYTSEQNIESVHQISREVAALAGIFDNTNVWARSFPTTWRIGNWIKVMCFSIPYYFFGIASQAFAELSRIGENEHGLTGKENDGDHSVMFFFAQRYISPKTGRISVLDRLWILGLLLGLMFASVHQTAVVMIWVILEIAKRPEQVPGLREEIIPETFSDGSQRLTYASVRNAERLDSFIREVMRMKGDTLSTVRMSVQDVKLGGYDIPAGSYVIPLASLSYRNQKYHGHDAEEFVADRWIGTGKPAIMAGPGYWPFGLGRWACPGRSLAVSEIKLAVLLLIEHFTPTLAGGEYEVLDPLNVVSVAPRGQITFVPFEK